MSTRRVSPLGALLVLAAIAAGLWLGTRTPGMRADAEADVAAATQADGASAGLVRLPARTVDGAALRLTAAGAPTVVMVSSETCTFCKAALREMARVANGRPLAGLRVVTLEGAAAGVPMTTAAGVVGATLAGPASRSEEALWTFQVRGTPTFVALDSAGRVTGTMVGYLGADALRSWIGVMLGERGAP